MNEDMYLHLIPGGPYISLYNTVTSDEPFTTKATNAAMAGTALGLHAIFAAHHAVRIQDAMIKSRGYYSGRTYGWGFYRAAYPVLATSAAVAGIVTAGAVASHAIAGEKGTDDYFQYLSEPKHMPFRTSWSIARLIGHYF